MQSIFRMSHLKLELYYFSFQLHKEIQYKTQIQTQLKPENHIFLKPSHERNISVNKLVIRKFRIIESTKTGQKTLPSKFFWRNTPTSSDRQTVRQR